MVWPAFPQCLEGYSRETGSVVNKIQCRIREYVDGTRNVTSAWEVRYAEIWPRMRVWKKKRIFEIAMKKVWDARSGPSFPDPTNLLLFFLSCALPFAVYCSGQFSVQNLCQTALELQSELSDCSCILSWSHSTIWHDILALTNLQGFTKNKISHQHKQATFLLLRVKTAVFDLAVHFQSQRTGFENAPTKRRRSTSISQLPILDPLLKLALPSYTIYSISLPPSHS